MNPFFVVHVRRRPQKMTFGGNGVVSVHLLAPSGKAWQKLVSYSRFAPADVTLLLAA